MTTNNLEMTPEQIVALLEDDYLQLLVVEGKIIAQGTAPDAAIFLFE